MIETNQIRYDEKGRTYEILEIDRSQPNYRNTHIRFNSETMWLGHEWLEVNTYLPSEYQKQKQTLKI